MKKINITNENLDKAIKVMSLVTLIVSVATTIAYYVQFVYTMKSLKKQQETETNDFLSDVDKDFE